MTQIKTHGGRDLVLKKLRKRIQQIKKKRPGYAGVLDFYLNVRKAQDKAKASLRVEPISFKKEWRDLLAREGFPLLDRRDLPVNIESSTALFHTLCGIARDSNPHMEKEVKKIEDGIAEGKIDLKGFFQEAASEEKVKRAARKMGADRKILLFLLHHSIRPSIEAAKEQLGKEVDAENWLKGFCPICGSLPSIGLMKEEAGKRFLLCSHCECQWRVERFFCPFCKNKEQQTLHYFHAEGEDAHRIDLCDKCRRYIKVIDLRKIEEADPVLEDIATLHLDLLASRKGYKRPVPNAWTA
jgi:FdhE protein